MAKTEKGRPVADLIVRSGDEEWIVAFVDALTPKQQDAFWTEWQFWAERGQRVPKGRWQTWLLMAGRGYGKTRIGAEWVRQQARLHHNARIALVGATLHEARAVMIEGESGLLSICRAPEEKLVWEPSNKRLRWANGAQAFLFSAADPESLRGAQHSHAWADEIGKWEQGIAAWDNLWMGLRLRSFPRAVATTTPRSVPLVLRLKANKTTVVTQGRSADNRAHLPGAFLAAMQENYGGTRLGRQELDGELIEDVEGALWKRELIERCRVRAEDDRHAWSYARVVIGVDPPAGASSSSDACGIVAVALGQDGIGYVIGDHSIGGLGPEGWARAVADAAGLHGADRIVAEANNGGAMVESVLRAAEEALPIRLVHASRGKVARAEPVAALFGRGRAKFLGTYPELEDELAGLQTGGRYHGPGRSPDRADAMVWAFTELMLAKSADPHVRVL